MGSDALAPAFVHNVFDPLEIGGVQRQKVAARKIDDFGEVRQFYVLVFGQQTRIKVLKQPLARTRLLHRYRRQTGHTLIAAGGGLYILSVALFQQSQLPQSV